MCFTHLILERSRSITFSHPAEFKSVRYKSNNLETLKFILTLQFNYTVKLWICVLVRNLCLILSMCIRHPQRQLLLQGWLRIKTLFSGSCALWTDCADSGRLACYFQIPPKASAQRYEPMFVCGFVLVWVFVGLVWLVVVLVFFFTIYLYANSI